MRSAGRRAPAAARRLAAALAAAAMLAGAAAAQPATRSPSEVTAAAGPATLAVQDVLFAVHRMAGTEPDFQALAELVLEAAPPPAHRVRDPAAERRYLLAITARRLRAEFAAFDLGRPFVVEFAADILGHDRDAGLIPVDFAPRPVLPLRDPLGGRPFELRFRNADAIRAIPAPDPDAASELLRGAGLASIGDWAGPGLVRLTLVFAGVLPRVAEVEAVPVLAEILSATVESAGGTVLHRFRQVGSAAEAAELRGRPPVLRQADLDGVRIGMALPAAEAAASRAFPDRFGEAFFAGLPEQARRHGVRPDCSVGVVADIRAFAIPLAPEDSYAACLAFVPGAPEGPLAGRVAAVTRLRFLPGATDAEIRADLQERLGPPLEQLAWGQLVWVGRDPSGSVDHGLLEVRAEHVRVPEGGPRREEGQLLAVTVRRFEPGEDNGS